jgi:hypothetical protein
MAQNPSFGWGPVAVIFDDSRCFAVEVQRGCHLDIFGADFALQNGLNPAMRTRHVAEFLREQIRAKPTLMDVAGEVANDGAGAHRHDNEAALDRGHLLRVRSLSPALRG